MIRKLCVVVYLTCLLPSLSSAVLIDADWKNTGDQLLTVDTETGLAWLDLTETAGLSFNSVAGSLGSGMTYENFRYASTDELTTFYSHAGITLLDTPSESLFLPVSQLLSRMGSLDSFQGGNTVGLLAPTGPGYEPILGQYQIALTGGTGFASVNVGTRPPDDAFSFQGSFLVTAIPEPTTALLLGLGLVGMAGYRRP